MGRRFTRHVEKAESQPFVCYGGGRDFPYPLIHLEAHSEIGKILQTRQALDHPIRLPCSDGLAAACEARVARLLSEDMKRKFRSWGPRRYPDRDYDMPVAVSRGFKRHIEATRK